MHSTHDSRQLTESARAASPANLEYHERMVDPDGALPPPERRRRAEQAKKAYFARLAFQSTKARRSRAGRSRAASSAPTGEANSV